MRQVVWVCSDYSVMSGRYVSCVKATKTAALNWLGVAVRDRTELEADAKSIRNGDRVAERYEVEK